LVVGSDASDNVIQRTDTFPGSRCTASSWARPSQTRARSSSAARTCSVGLAPATATCSRLGCSA